MKYSFIINKKEDVCVFIFIINLTTFLQYYYSHNTFILSSIVFVFNVSKAFSALQSLMSLINFNPVDKSFL